MDKKKSESKLKGIVNNIFVKNILMMAAIFVAMLVVVLIILNLYTKHNESVVIPPLSGLQVPEAAAILKSSDLKYEVIDSMYQAGGAPGAILDQIPKEQAKVKRGRTVYLTIQSTVEQVVAIPELKDFSQRQAEAQLNSLGFSKIQIEYTPAAYSGLVVSISYKGKVLTAGQKIPKGSNLKMVVGGGGDTMEEDSIQQSETTSNVEVDKTFFD